MSTVLRTCFNETYESPEDGIAVRDEGGRKHFGRRQFALVSPTKGVLASATVHDLSGERLKQAVDDVFTRAGFKLVEPAHA